MADDNVDAGPRRRHAQSQRRTRAARKHGRAEDEQKDDKVKPHLPSLDELRQSRVEYFSKPVSEKRKIMSYVYDAPAPRPKKSPVKDEPKHRRVDSSHRIERRKAGIEGRSQKQARVQAGRDNSETDTEDDSDAGKVYVTRKEPERESNSLRSKKRVDKDRKDTKSTKPISKISNRPAPQRRHTVTATTMNKEDKAEFGSRRQSVRDQPSRRSLPIADVPPPLKRSATSGQARTEVSLARSSTTLRPAKKAPSAFSSWFQPSPPSPEKKASCLTCGDDDVAVSKSAKLPCKHRMCHSCLRRLFKMSITDPAHMPPRCCTDDHIDLKHVDKLFSQDFKKTWNRKFLEYKTKNRVYCIGRNCGDWIKPNHITLEHGRKIGKCKRCGTKVCAICNNKAHMSRDCPKDPATKQFIETAKQKGWQKCFNCAAMVELKEGCNHMTCRCMAEFCMVCGLKWKSCDCPWFNYENADAHLGNPQRYQEEMDRRRDQEDRDEALAQRMEVLGIDANQADGFFGIGNAAGHHMNQNFIQQAREALTANYANAEQAARGLLNGWYTGRENRMPDIPEALADVPRILRRASQRLEEPIIDPAEADRTGRRRRNPRRQRAGQEQGPVLEGRDQPTEEERIREWATGVQ